MARKTDLDDPSNPTGTVTVWAKVEDSFSMPAAYGTLDREKLFRKALEIDAKIESIGTSLKIAKMDEEQEKPCWYTLPLVLESVKNLPSSENIIFAGQYNNMFKATQAVIRQGEIYQERILKLLHDGKLKVPEHPSGLYDALDNDPKRILNHLTTKYINPMIFARLQGDSDEYEVLKLVFLEINEGTVFVNDASKICKEIEKMSSSSPNTSAIDVLVNKIAEESARKKGRLWPKTLADA